MPFRGAVSGNDKGREMSAFAWFTEDWNMEESQVVAGWIAKGEERGEKRGLEKGLERGRRETLRDMLIEVLEVRFGRSLSNELLAALRAEESQERLSRWFREAL